MDLKVCLLDRRFGKHGGSGKTKPYWVKKHGKDWKNKQHFGQENTFAFVDAFDTNDGVLCGAIEKGEDYTRLKDFDILYLRIRGPEGVVAIKRMREQCHRPVIIGYCDELVNWRIPPDFNHVQWIAEVSKYVDVLTSSFPEKYERPKHEALGITNWEFCPYAGDVLWWRNYYQEQKEREISGMWHIRSFMRGGFGDVLHSQTFKTMKYLQDEYNVKCRFFLNFDGWKSLPLIEPYVKHLGLEVELTKHTGSQDIFNKLMANTRVFMEEYQSPAYSRATVVSAAVGTPQVGTDMNTPSNILFPELTVQHGDWDGFREKVELLLTNDSFYRDIQAKGLYRTSYFYYEQFKERILKLYEKCLNELR